MVSTTPAPTPASKAARPPRPPAEPITKRLHISGLTNPSITHADLRQRFASFGTVQAVDGVGLDGNGFPRSFAFVTLLTTAPQVSRCLSLLSGATWKSCVLRIGEARPPIADRQAAERALLKRALDDPALEADGSKRKTKRRLAKGVHGLEAKRMEPVDAANSADKKHWHLTPLQHLVRPMLLQPLHPIPRPALPVPSSSNASSSKTSAAAAAAKLATAAAAAAPKKKKTGKRAAGAPSRARRIVIDPRRYERTHLSGDMLDPGMAALGLGGGSLWVCGEKDDDGQVVWVSADGTEERVVVGKEERLRLVLRSLSGAGAEDELAEGGAVLSSEEEDDDDDEGGEDSWPSLGPTTEAAAALFGADDDDMAVDGGSDDDQAAASDAAADEDNDDDGDDDDDFPSLLPASDRAASPLFAAPSPPPAPTPAAAAPAPAVAKPTPAKPAAAAAPVAPAVAHGKYVPAPASKETTGPSNPALRAPSQPSQIKPVAPSNTAPAAKARKAADPELAALVAAEKSRGLGVFASLFGGADDEAADNEAEGKTLGAVSFLDDEDDASSAPSSSTANKAVKLPSWVHDDSDSEAEPAVVAAPAPARTKSTAAPKASQAKPAAAAAAAAAAPPSPVKKQVTFDASVPVPPSPSPEPDLDTVMDVSTDAGDEDEPEEEAEELDPVQLAMKELRDWEAAQDAKRLAAESAAAATAAAPADVLRIRGGAYTAGDSDDEDEGPQRKKTDVGQLKAMFAPRTTEAPSFSLFGGLDIDLDDEEDPTLTATLPTRRSPPPFQQPYAGAASASSGGAYVHPSRAFAPGLSAMPLGNAPSYGVAPPAPSGPSLPLGKQPFRPDAATPYFFSHLHLTEAEAAKGPKQQSRSLLALEHDKRFNTGCGGFWRPEAETDQAAEDKWEEVKGVLTKDWKARAKGAKRKGRGAGKAGEDGPDAEAK